MIRRHKDTSAITEVKTQAVPQKVEQRTKYSQHEAFEELSPTVTQRRD